MPTGFDVIHCWLLVISFIAYIYGIAPLYLRTSWCYINLVLLLLLLL